MIDSPYINKKLASLLLHRKLITRQQLEEISLDKSLAKQDFLDYLIDHELIDSRSFMIESATLLRLQYIDLTAINVNFYLKIILIPNFVMKINAYLYSKERKVCM